MFIECFRVYSVLSNILVLIATQGEGILMLLMKD